jgi:hypothetical protein
MTCTPPNTRVIGSDIFAYACKEYLHSNSILEIRRGLQLAIKLIDVLQPIEAAPAAPVPAKVVPAPIKVVEEAPPAPKKPLPPPSDDDDDDDDELPAKPIPKPTIIPVESGRPKLGDTQLERMKRNGVYTCSNCRTFTTESGQGMKKHYNKCGVV